MRLIISTVNKVQGTCRPIPTKNAANPKNDMKMDELTNQVRFHYFFYT